MKSTYWSCSKFADWIRGTPRLDAGTAEEWGIGEKKAAEKPIRYWLAEEGLDYLQHFIFWPVNRFRNMVFYINNRWITKSHALTSNLKRGEWQDFDGRLLHAVFDELVNFVEIEQAWMHVVCSEEDRKKYKAPWYRTFFRIRLWRCPEAGLAYLEWASELKKDEAWIDKNDPEYGKLTSQALAAQETRALYNWWKNERPNRPDPMDASGLSNYYEERRKEAELRGDDPLLGMFNSDKTRDERSDNLSRIYHKMEEEQNEEDTHMLIRLVKIRHSLWT